MMGNKALWEAMSEKDRLLAGEVTDEVGMRLAELEGVIAEENGYTADTDAAELLLGALRQNVAPEYAAGNLKLVLNATRRRRIGAAAG